MEKKVTVRGTYSPGFGYVSVKWEQICRDHEQEFPQIHECHPGTFNLTIELASVYVPPGENVYRRMARERGKSIGKYGDGNHLSPRAKVTEMNGRPVEAWIYRGGHGNTVLELLSTSPLAETLLLKDGDTVTALIVEYSDEGGLSMPGPPPLDLGKNPDYDRH